MRAPTDPDIKKGCDGFLAVVYNVFGLYHDASMAFAGSLANFLDTQQMILANLRATQPDLATLDYLDSVSFSYFHSGDPGEPGAVELHRSTQGEFKRRNVVGGDNYVFLANVCLVTIYQYWEDHFRPAIAKAMGIQKDELRAPIMGDLRRLRQSIIHHGGVAIPEVETAERLRWFHSGDRIALSAAQMETIVAEIAAFVSTLGSRGASTSRDQGADG